MPLWLDTVFDREVHVCVLLMLMALQTVRAGEAGLEEGREDGWVLSRHLLSKYTNNFPGYHSVQIGSNGGLPLGEKE